MKKIFFVLGTVTLLCANFPATADITATSAEVAMRIDLGVVTEISKSDSGATFAAVDLVGPTSGIEVSGLLDINALTAETANLSFDFIMNGNGYVGIGYMGQDGPATNAADIDYHAFVDSELEYAWNFDYLGPNSFGLARIALYENGNMMALLGNTGNIGHHEGEDAFNLMAGNDYTISVVFNPNVFGNIGALDGELAGDISFDFNGAFFVPIDIKFCSDPNAFNCKKKGVLPVTIFGTDTFDVASIDLSALRLCTEDLSACTGAPRDYSIADRGDPTSDLGAAQCELLEVEEGIFEEQDYLYPDGFIDLDAAFEASEVQDMLGTFCSDVKGATSETLVITGSTLDGTPFISVPIGNTGTDQLWKVNK